MFIGVQFGDLTILQQALGTKKSGAFIIWLSGRQFKTKAVCQSKCTSIFSCRIVYSILFFMDKTYLPRTESN